MGQCSNRGPDEGLDLRPQGAVSLENARRLSSNAAVTSARYHYYQCGRHLHDDYIVEGSVLGRGLCGEVVLAWGRIDGRKYALKTIRKLQVPQKQLKQLTSEVEIYLTVDHPNIARLHDVYETEEDVSLLSECCEGGELYYRLQVKGVYSNDDAAEAARQMFRAVSYLHSHNIVHRDLKLENFLYESEAEDAQLKLIDFGFAKVWDPSRLMMSSCGSIAYVSPDVLTGAGYTNKCDMWSMGVVVFMLLSGYPPFHGDEKQMLLKIKHAQADWSHSSRWKPVAPEALDLVQQLLSKDPNCRPSAQQALQHPWLAGAARGGKAGGVPALLSREALRSLRRYADASKVRRAVLQLLAQELRPEETQELREMFLAMDQSHQGTISLRDLKDAIRGAGGRSPSRRAGNQEAYHFHNNGGGGSTNGLEGMTSVASTPTPCATTFSSMSPFGAASSPPSVAGGYCDSEAPTSEGSPSSPTRALRRANSGYLDELFGLLDANGHHRIYYSDFLAATLEARSRLREEAVRAAFSRLDADGSGTIGADDLRSVIGSTFEGVDVEELVRQVDPKGKEEINFETFVRVLEDRDASVSPTSRSRTAAVASAGGSPRRRALPAFFMEENYGGC